MATQREIILAKKIAKKRYSVDYVYNIGYQAQFNLGRDNPLNQLSVKASVKVQGLEGKRILL